MKNVLEKAQKKNSVEEAEEVGIDDNAKDGESTFDLSVFTSRDGALDHRRTGVDINQARQQMRQSGLGKRNR